MATYSISLTRGSIVPGPITSLMLVQIRRREAGSCASTFQKLLTQSVLRVAMMSSYTARTSGEASLYSMGVRVALISGLASDSENDRPGSSAGFERGVRLRSADRVGAGRQSRHGKWWDGSGGLPEVDQGSE